jgi:hypothetical protein
MESIAISQPVGRSLSDLIELEPQELEKVAAWCAQRCIGTARDEQRTLLLLLLLLQLLLLLWKCFALSELTTMMSFNSLVCWGVL